jgi:hypothetical protein
LEERLEIFLVFVQQLIDRFKAIENEMDEHNAELESWESQATIIPESAKLDRLLRYSTSLQRDYERNQVQLDALQRVRKGQPIIPTLR